MPIGYASVSALEQNEDLQTDTLKKARRERIYVDYSSGAKGQPSAARPSRRITPYLMRCWSSTCSPGWYRHSRVRPFCCFPLP